MESVVISPDGDPIHIHRTYGLREPFWVPVTFANIHGVWKAFNITAQVTTVIATSDNDGYLVATGITLAMKKVNQGNVAIRFSDGTNDEEFFNALATNNEINIDFNWTDQNVYGWKDANLEIVTSGSNPTLTGMVRYFKVNEGLPYDEWQNLQ